MTEDLCGTLLEGKYEIQTLLGAGGEGSVYRAVQLDLNRDVAIKVLHFSTLADLDSRARFEREARVLSSLDHPNIVKVYHIGLLPSGSPYMVLEFLEGLSLADILVTRETIEWRGVSSITKQVCKALEAAHSRGIIHRDLKPHNILLLQQPEKDTVKVVDFGLSKLLLPAANNNQKLTQTGALIGSVQYMSPELCSGSPVDARSDIYSLGCVMYQCIEGKPPFDYENAIGMLHMHVNEPPPPLSGDGLPRGFVNVIMKALEKRPDNRFQTMAELYETLEAIEGGDSAPAAIRDYSRKSATTWSGKNLLTLAAITFLSGGIAFAMYFAFKSANMKTSSADVDMVSTSDFNAMNANYQKAASLARMSREQLNGGQRSKAWSTACLSARTLSKLRSSEGRTVQNSIADVRLLNEIVPVLIECHPGRIESLLKGASAGIETNDSVLVLENLRTRKAYSKWICALNRHLAVLKMMEGNVDPAMNDFGLLAVDLLDEGDLKGARECLTLSKTLLPKALSFRKDSLSNRLTAAHVSFSDGDREKAVSELQAVYPQIHRRGTRIEFLITIRLAEKTKDFPMAKELVDEFMRRYSSFNDHNAMNRINLSPEKLGYGKEFEKTYANHRNRVVLSWLSANLKSPELQEYIAQRYIQVLNESKNVDPPAGKTNATGNPAGK